MKSERSGACVKILLLRDPADPWNFFPHVYLVHPVWINKRLFNCISQSAPESFPIALTLSQFESTLASIF